MASSAPAITSLFQEERASVVFLKGLHEVARRDFSYILLPGILQPHGIEREAVKQSLLWVGMLLLPLLLLFGC